MKNEIMTKCLPKYIGCLILIIAMTCDIFLNIHIPILFFGLGLLMGHFITIGVIYNDN